MDERRFNALWRRRFGAGGSAAFQRIDVLYREPHRRYHGPRHIEHCLRQLDLAGALVPNRDAVEMALWFHDAVYDVPAGPDPNNEQRSADLFLHCAAGRGHARFRDDVRRLILTTAHAVLPVPDDERYVVDIDLAGFGLGWAAFARNGADLRAEQPALSDAEFAARQEAFLRALLARPTFCFTDFFRARHETAARRNIERHLALQAAHGGSPE